MNREIAEQLVRYGKDEFDGDLRTVICYSRESYHPIYIRDDIGEVIAESERNAYRIPTFQFQRSALHISRLFESRGAPQVITRTYNDHHVLQFPISGEEGILFSFDSEGEISEDVLMRCKDIVHREGDSSEFHATGS